jgi:hypothetical protein
VQQPHLEDKTMLRKKFSWKHFPEVREDCTPPFVIFCVVVEALISRFAALNVAAPLCLQLERFLIENRDEYLRHSSKNYTAEQKQYNNRLTEELLQVAEEYHYIFDPEDFNFVAIRDRIRCYYKSYVQTARKRGLQVSSISPSKKQKVKKESKGTDTEAYIKDEENDDVVIDKETDDKQSDEMDADDKKVDEEKAGEKKVDEEKVVEKKIEESEADAKNIYEKAASSKKIDETATADKKIDEKATAEKKIDEAAAKIDEKATAEKKIDETAEKKIDETAEKKIDEKGLVDKVTGDQKTAGKGPAEELNTADANEAHSAGVGKAA